MKSVTRLLYIAIASLLISLPALAVEEKPDPLKEIQKDIASLKTATDQIQKELAGRKESSPDKRYVEILEKINQQLSLSWTPYSVTFTVLAVLIAFSAILSAVVLYFQGSAHKKALEKSRESFDKSLNELKKAQEAAINKFIEDENKRAAETKENIDQTVNQFKEMMAATSKEGKEEIKKAIRDLEVKKATLPTDIGSRSEYGQAFSRGFSRGFSAFPESPTLSYKCPRCGVRSYSTSIGVLLPREVECTGCGFIFDPQ